MTLPNCRLRPLTLFESEDPSLDPEAITHALPPQDKLFTGTLSLILCGAIAASIALWPEILVAERKDGPVLPLTILKHMDIILETSHQPVSIPGPTGGGDQGTGGQTAKHLTALPTTQVETIPSHETIPETLTQEVGYLPIVPGGNGRSPGSGSGSGGGIGGGIGGGKGWGTGRQVTPNKPEFDYQLTPITKVMPIYSLRPGQNAIATIVVVQIIVEEDGRVSSAKALKGPDFLWSNAENNALCWTFEPLAQHGLKAPHADRITFHYTPTSFKR